MVHSWREKLSIGVPAIPDLSKFMLIEAIATIFLLVIGLVVPTVQVSGLYKLLPFLLMASMCIPADLCGRLRNNNYRILLYFVFGGIGLAPARLCQDFVSRWTLWSWGGGLIIGLLISNHYAYMRFRKMANKYGPFACLWFRHVKKNIYEFLLVKTDGTLAWHYQAQDWYRHIDPLLGSTQAIELRADVRNKGWESKPLGGWFQCYPALVATRMVGMRRRNPVDWVRPAAQRQA